MDKIETLEKIDEMRKELDELVNGFDELREYRIANNLSGGFIRLTDAIAKMENE